MMLYACFVLTSLLFAIASPNSLEDLTQTATGHTAGAQILNDEDSGQSVGSLGRFPGSSVLSPGDSVIQISQGHGKDSTVTIHRCSAQRLPRRKLVIKCE